MIILLCTLYSITSEEGHLGVGTACKTNFIDSEPLCITTTYHRMALCRNVLWGGADCNTLPDIFYWAVSLQGDCTSGSSKCVFPRLIRPHVITAGRPYFGKEKQYVVVVVVAVAHVGHDPICN